MSDDATRTQQPAAPAAGEPPGTRTFGAPDGTGTFAPAPDGLAGAAPVIPGYEVLESVGHGGMGRVYRARQLATNRVVAVKLILAGEFAGAGARERFRAEIETTARLSHPHIVQLYEAGEADGRAFLSCEFVAGGSLAARLDGTPWEGKRAARLLVPLAQAVAHAHAAGIVHRDLKPANILLALDGTPKVADFGIAKQMDSDSQTHTGAILGTPSYMPPEQAGSARAVGAPADVYSLGAVLYELLTGRPPFKGADFVATIDLVRTQEPVPPHVLQPKLPRDIETICLKCLQKAPAKRYPTAEALAEDLGRFLEGRPILARPVGLFERAARWAKRNPALTGATAAVALALVTGTAVSAYFAVEAGKRAKESEKSATRAADREREVSQERDNVRAEQGRTEQLLYAAQIFQAQVAAAEYRTARLTQLLDDARRLPSGRDRRGWEWHHLRRLTRTWDSEGKLDSVGSGLPAFDPKQQFLSWSFSTDGTRARALIFSFRLMEPPADAMFDLATGRGRAAPAPKPDGGWSAVWSVADPDLRFAASVESHEVPGTGPPNLVGPPRPGTHWRVRVWNLATGGVLMTTPDYPEQPSPFLTAGATRLIVGLPVPQTPDPATGGGEYPRLEVWDRNQPAPVPRVIRTGGDKKPAHASVFSPDGTRAVVIYREKDGKVVLDGNGFGTSSSNRLEIWDIGGEPKPCGRTYSTGSGDSFGWAVFSPGGQVVAVSEGGKAVGVYDARTGRRVGLWELPRDAGGQNLWSAAVSDDGRKVAVSGMGGVVIVGERVRESQASAIGPGGGGIPPVPAGTDDIGGWTSHVLRDAPSPNWGTTPIWLAGDGRRLISGGGDGAFRTWDLTRTLGFAATWPETRTLGGEVAFAAPSSRGRWVFYSPNPGGPEPKAKPIPVGVFDVHNQKLVCEFDTEPRYGCSGAVSADGSRVLLSHYGPQSFSGPNGSGRWSVRATADPTRELVGGRGNAWFSDDGRWLLDSPELYDFSANRVDQVQRVTVRRVSDGGPVAEVRAGGNGTTAATAHTAPDGTVVFVTHPALKPPAPDNANAPTTLTFRFHDPATGRELAAWEMPSPCPVGPSPAAFATATATQPSHTPDLPGTFFSPDGRKFAVSQVGADGSVRAWVLDVRTGRQEQAFAAPAAESGRAPLAMPGFGGYQAGTGGFGPNGRLAVWANRDVVAWNGSSAAPIRLTGHDAGGSVAFTSDGSRLFTLDPTSDGTAGGRLRVFELTAGRELMSFRVTNDSSGGGFGFAGNAMWMEGERLHVQVGTGVRVFDGTPLKE